MGLYLICEVPSEARARGTHLKFRFCKIMRIFFIFEKSPYNFEKKAGISYIASAKQRNKYVLVLWGQNSFLIFDCCISRIFYHEILLKQCPRPIDAA